MENLRCTGCKATIVPTAIDIQFVTCEYCRKTNKNPNFQPVKKPTTTSEVNSNSIPSSQPTASNQHQIPHFTGRRRKRGCGLGCGCLLMFLFLPMIISLLSIIFGGYFSEFWDLILELINSI